MIINKLYKVDINCSVNEALIDTENIMVTVHLSDFNNVDVEEEDVVLSVDRGEFTSVIKGHGGYIHDNRKVVSGRTNESGEFSVFYKASEWGLATFNVESAKNQIYVKGWKTVFESGDGITVKSNGILGSLIVRMKNNVNIPKKTWITLNQVPYEYRTNHTVAMYGHHASIKVYLRMVTTGEIQVGNYNSEDIVNGSLYCGRIYSLKKPLF